MIRKKIMSYFLVFIFSLLLFLLGLRTLTSATLFNENFHYRNQHKIAYYPRLTSFINQEIEDLLASYEISPLLHTSVVTDHDIYYYIRTGTKQAFKFNFLNKESISDDAPFEKMIEGTVDFYFSRLHPSILNLSQNELETLKQEINELIFESITFNIEKAFVNESGGLLKEYLVNALSLNGIMLVFIWLWIPFIGLIWINRKQKTYLLLYSSLGCLLTSSYYFLSIWILGFLYRINHSEISSIQNELLLVIKEQLNYYCFLSALFLIIVGLLLLISFYSLTEWKKFKELGVYYDTEQAVL